MILIKFICNLFHIFIIKPSMKTKTKSIQFIQCSPIFECCMYAFSVYWQIYWLFILCIPVCGAMSFLRLGVMLCIDWIMYCCSLAVFEREYLFYVPFSDFVFVSLHSMLTSSCITCVWYLSSADCIRNPVSPSGWL